MAKPNPTSTSRAAVKRTTANSGDQQLRTVIEGEISTGEAADILGVSVPHLIGLLDAGRLPYRKSSDRPDAHRYVRTDDVLDYRRRRANAQNMMHQYGAISEKLGV
jgi:hypothetical protein